MTDEIKGLFREDTLGAGGIEQMSQPINQEQYDGLKGSNLLATTNPTVNDDNTQGHAVNSIWVNLTLDRVFICLDASTGAAVWHPFGEIGYRVGWGLSDIASGSHHAAGALEQVVTAQDVDSGSNPNVTDMNRFRIMINVTTLNVAGTMRITGTSYSPATGATTPADTEDIVIDSVGWYCSSKFWDGTITLSDISGLDIVIDGYRYEPYSDLLPKSKLTNLHYTGKATVGLPSLQVEVFKFDPVAKTFDSIFDVTQTATLNTSLHNERELNISLDFPNAESLYMRMTVTAINDVQFELGFERTV